MKTQSIKKGLKGLHKGNQKYLNDMTESEKEVYNIDKTILQEEKKNKKELKQVAKNMPSKPSTPVEENPEFAPKKIEKTGSGLLADLVQDKMDKVENVRTER
jgi:hypothetical protein